MWTKLTAGFSNVSVRFVASLLVLIVGFGAGISIYLRAFTEDSYLTRQRELQHIVSLAENAISPIVEERRQGRIAIGEARVRAAEVLNRFVYTDGSGPNFVFFASYEGYILVEPYKPDKVGTYQMQRRDLDGTAITQELRQTAQAGGGFVFYYESRTENAPTQKKLSYVVGIPELECYLGTGMYVDDIEASVNTLLKRLVLLSFFILAVILSMQYYFLYPLLHCFSTMSNVFQEFDQNHAALQNTTAVQHREGAGEPEQLIEKVQNMMEMLKTDRIALRERVAEVHRLAYSDPLTNLPNRAFLEEWFKAELEAAAAGHTYGAVMFLDLNDFKRVNDLFGHSSGDKLLMQTGARINQALPEKGRIFRLGGDEFIIVLPSVTGDEAEVFAEKILQETACPYVFQDETFYVTGSLGIAVYPQDGLDLDSLLSKVDTAMYNAKEGKKNGNGYTRFAPSMHEAILHRIKLERSLAKALENHQLEIFYQPQFDIVRNKPVAIEALLRWNRPGEHPISPVEFIPIAEESGLIIPIGQWVLTEACKFCRHLHSLGYHEIYVTVNMSTKQVEQSDFISQIRKVLDQTGLSPQSLELEITESLFMNSLDLCKNKLSQIRSMGIRLALDDFGTGYSSLTRLRVLPFNVLKIDKAFLQEKSSEQEEIIRTIIKLAHVLGLEVVAEGVETVEQLNLVFAALGDRVQGYYFSRPLSSEVLIQFLDEFYDM